MTKWAKKTFGAKDKISKLQNEQTTKSAVAKWTNTIWSKWLNEQMTKRANDKKKKNKMCKWEMSTSVIDKMNNWLTEQMTQRAKDYMTKEQTIQANEKDANYNAGKW